MELKSLWIGEGGLPRREEERGGARGEGEAPVAAPLLGASTSAIPAAPPGPAGGNSKSHRKHRVTSSRSRRSSRYS